MKNGKVSKELQEYWRKRDSNPSGAEIFYTILWIVIIITWLLVTTAKYGR